MAAPAKVVVSDRTEVHSGELDSVQVWRGVSKDMADVHAVADLGVPEILVDGHVSRQLSLWSSTRCKLNAPTLSCILTFLKPVQ